MTISSVPVDSAANHAWIPHNNQSLEAGFPGKEVLLEARQLSSGNDFPRVWRSKSFGWRGIWTAESLPRQLSCLARVAQQPLQQDWIGRSCGPTLHPQSLWRSSIVMFLCYLESVKVLSQCCATTPSFWFQSIYHPQKKPCTHLAVFPDLPFPLSLTTTSLHSLSVDLPILIFHRN